MSNNDFNGTSSCIPKNGDICLERLFPKDIIEEQKRDNKLNYNSRIQLSPVNNELTRSSRHR